MNRQIIISTGESRKATNWKKEQMLWSEFVERLKIPSKSTETLEEYMKLPKAKQDDLKDVGGFVAGELKDGKRKNTNVVSRDVVTLDLDSIEAGKTQAQLGEMIGSTGQYVNRIIKKGDGVMNKTFVEMLDALGYDIQLTYVKKEEA